MKDIDNPYYFLGLEIHSTFKGIYIHQHKYSTNLISMDGFQSENWVDTTLEASVKYHCNDGFLSVSLLYQKLLDSHKYSIITPLDISFDV